MTEGDREPRMLMMTATPIPRTLAMSYYADLDVSHFGRLPPDPHYRHQGHQRRQRDEVVYIRAQIAQNRQIYWVCPLIGKRIHHDLVNAAERMRRSAKRRRRGGRPAAFAHAAGRKKGGDEPVHRKA
jgi:RecG-like helicase